MSDEGSTVTKEKVEKYLALTAEAREKATPIAASEEDIARLDSMMRMCDDYQADAKHFLEQGDLVRAFGAINYAHAWICLLYTSPSPRDVEESRMPSSA